MDRDDSNTSEDRFQVLLTYLAANAAELRQLQCQDMASLLRTGEARRGKPAIPDRAALYRFLQRQGHAFTEGQRGAPGMGGSAVRVAQASAARAPRSV